MTGISSSFHVTPETQSLGSNKDSDPKDTNTLQKEISVASEKADEIILEPVDQNPYELSYTCLLLPRLSSQNISGDVTSNLNIWMKQICTAFRWRLDYISIEAGHMHWTMRVPPATSTAHFMQVIREQTSQRLFANFPRLQEDSSKDFWATGYLIVSGSQPHPAEVIQRFIRITRQQQGEWRGQ